MGGVVDYVIAEKGDQKRKACLQCNRKVRE